MYWNDKVHRYADAFYHIEHTPDVMEFICQQVWPDYLQHKGMRYDVVVLKNISYILISWYRLVVLKREEDSLKVHFGNG